VLVLERHPPVIDEDTDNLFRDWERPGIAHFRQPHNFLGLARQVLREEAPDVLTRANALEHDDQLIARGEEIACAGGVTAPAGPSRSELLETIELAASGARQT
jgi:hypothetical protein